MLIFLANSTTDKKSNSEEIIFLLEKQGIRVYPTRFGNRSVLVLPEKSPVCCCVNDLPLCDWLKSRNEIEEIVNISEPYQLGHRQLRPDGTAISIRDFSLGRGSFIFMAGPCTVESEKQTFETALIVKEAGAKILRGGAFKPRTSPYAFQGLKREGLKILQKVGKETGLAVVTEAMSIDEVQLVAEFADIVQIGTRNAQNYRLLEACGKIKIPILLKRGFSCTLEEFLMSAEYILAGGNDQVILCERGIRTFENEVRYSMPIGSIPLLKKLTHLPLVVDPSHAAGRADLVPPISFAATAAGADGLLIEVHPDPQHALCDGRQSLTPEEFTKTVKICQNIRNAL